MDNFTGWNEVMGDITELGCIIFMDAKEEVMTQRILARAETSGRNDDNLETLHKRFVTFTNEQLPIIGIYSEKGKVKTVNALQDIDTVYADLKKAVAEYL